MIGSPVGTVLLQDFEHTDCIFFFGHNTTTNAPRMLHPLQEAAQRGVPIITFNPLRERGLERFTNPQNPLDSLTRFKTQAARLREMATEAGRNPKAVGLSLRVTVFGETAPAQASDGEHRLFAGSPALSPTANAVGFLYLISRFCMRIPAPDGVLLAMCGHWSFLGLFDRPPHAIRCARHVDMADAID